MARASYLIAKYVSDLFRNEPVNIGIIAWCDGATAFRFLATGQDGTVDGRVLRGKLRTTVSLDAYKQWIKSWVRLAAKDKINFLGKPEVASRSTEQFLTALESTSNGNYILERGGELLEDVAPSDIQSVADFLFKRLIEEDSEEQDETKAAKEVRDDLIKEADVGTDARVQLDKRVQIELAGGRTVYQEFHVYIGNGKPEWLAQVLPLTAHPKTVKTMAESMAWKFEKAVAFYRLPKDRAVALAYAPEERNDELISESLVELETVAQVMFLRSDRPAIVKSIRAWVDSVSLTH